MGPRSLAPLAVFFLQCVPYGWQYGYAVDPSLPAVEKAAVKKAVASWEAELPGPYPSKLEFYELPWENDLPGRIIYVAAAPLETVNAACGGSGFVGCTMHLRWPDQNQMLILLPSDRVPLTDVNALAAHEFGHALGLHHQPGPVLMNPTLNPRIPGPTTGDVVQFLLTR